MAEQLYAVIVGCGRLGALLANQLSRKGHSVVAIDNDADAFAGLAAEYSGFRIEGEATELAVLKEAKVDKADLVISTTREDNVNLMVAQIAKEVFKVPRVMARVFLPEYEDSYRRMGIEVVCPTRAAADMFLNALAEEEGSPK